MAAQPRKPKKSGASRDVGVSVREFTDRMADLKGFVGQQVSAVGASVDGLAQQVADHHSEIQRQLAENREEHRKHEGETHDTNQRVSRLENRQWFLSGGATVAGTGLGWLLKALFK